MRRRPFANILAAAIMILALGPAAGCDIQGVAKSTWGSSKSLYRDYVNTNPSLDLKAEGLTAADEQKLAFLFMPVDREVELILRRMGNQDSYPTEAWLTETLKRFPWLTGAAVVTMDGTVRFRQPEMSIKPLEIGPLLSFQGDYEKRRIRSFIDRNELGPEMYLAQPFFVDNKAAGLIVFHFDPRSLAPLSPNPEELLILAPGGPLWAASEVPQELAGADWQKILTSKVGGGMKAGNDSYAWLARFVGGEPIIYAVKADNSGKRSWWFW